MSEIKNKTDYVLDLNDIDASIKSIVGVDPNELRLSDMFGSCQYQSSELFHRLLDKVGHQALGISFTKAHKKPTNGLLSAIYDEIVTDYEWHAKDYMRWVEILQESDEWISENTWIRCSMKDEDGVLYYRENSTVRQETIDCVARMESRVMELLDWVENGIADWTLKQCMEFTRDSSWDLWSSAPFIMGYQFDNLQFKPMKSKAGRNMPPINAMIQGDDAYDTGMATHLLHKFCGVPISSMNGFDT